MKFIKSVPGKFIPGTLQVSLPGNTASWSSKRDVGPRHASSGRKGSLGKTGPMCKDVASIARFRKVTVWETGIATLGSLGQEKGEGGEPPWANQKEVPSFKRIQPTGNTEASGLSCFHKEGVDLRLLCFVSFLCVLIDVRPYFSLPVHQ